MLSGTGSCYPAFDPLSSRPPTTQAAEFELFVDSWQQVMIGQGLLPERYHPLVDTMPEQELADFIAHVEAGVDKDMARLQDHNTYLNSLMSRQRQ